MAAVACRYVRHLVVVVAGDEVNRLDGKHGLAHRWRSGCGHLVSVHRLRFFPIGAAKKPRDRVP